jgi:hypothetical protein
MARAEDAASFGCWPERDGWRDSHYLQNESQEVARNLT